MTDLSHLIPPIGYKSILQENYEREIEFKAALHALNINDSMNIPLSFLSSDKDYRWVRYSYFYDMSEESIQEGRQNLTEARDKGWYPSLARDYPEVIRGVIKICPFYNYILLPGLILCEKPKINTLNQQLLGVQDNFLGIGVGPDVKVELTILDDYKI